MKTYNTPLGKITIDAMQYHRNGVRGAGFTAILFRLSRKKYLAHVFENAGIYQGRVAVTCLDLIAAHGVGPENRWRGEDDFGPALRQAIADDVAEYDAGRVSMIYGQRALG